MNEPPAHKTPVAPAAGPSTITRRVDPRWLLLAFGALIVGVDDDPPNLLFLKMNLVSTGYTFIGAISGNECLNVVLRAPPRLILLDIEMPGLDGFETCRRLRTFPEIVSTPVAFLTARKTRDDVRQGVSVGGNDFIIKPFKRKHLLDRVGYWMTHRARAVLAVRDTRTDVGSSSPTVGE